VLVADQVTSGVSECWVQLGGLANESAAVRQIAGLLGRAPSSVSQVLSSMRASGLVDEQRKPALPELFWELAARWRPSHADVQMVPSR